MHGENSTHRVITMLKREEVDFLDKVGKDSLFTTGHKLSHNEILRALVDFAIESGIATEKIISIDSLKEAIISHIKSKEQK